MALGRTVVVQGASPQQMGESISRWVQRVTITTARKALQDEVRRGFDTKPVVVTDGTPRRAPEQVKPFGKIEFISRTTMADAVLWALAELQRKSPVLTGRYRASHVVMVDGAEVTGNIGQALRAVKPGQRVQIVNTTVYARKIEGATANKRTGRIRRRGIARKARNGVYRVVHRLLVQRFGRQIFFDFKYVPLSTGVRVWGAVGGGRTRRRVQRDQVYPALQFFQRSN